MRILPYRTADNVIDGVVMTFADITAMKQLEESLERQKAELQEARDYAESIIATIREPLVVLDGELADRLGQPLLLRDLPGDARRDRGPTALRDRPAAVGHSQPCGNSWRTFFPRTRSSRTSGWSTIFPRIGHKVLLLNARRVAQKDQQTHLILLAMEDITETAQTDKHLGVKP